MTYVMTAEELVKRAKSAASLKTVYAYGGLGYHGTEAQKARVLKAYPTENNKGKIRNADEDTWMFDCIGFVKAILNGFTATKKNPQTGRDYNYGGASFPASGFLSAKSGANDFFNNYCTDRTNDFSKIIPGSAVWKKPNGIDSHIGIYLGQGLVAECTPAWNDGVQITAVLNIGKVIGYNGRQWDFWGKIPCVDYKTSFVLEKIEDIPVEPEKVDATVIDAARSFDAKIGGIFEATATINLRAGAGLTKKKIAIIPKGNIVRCFGFYTTVLGLKWYLIQTNIKGVEYTGFCHSGYLRRK